MMVHRATKLTERHSAYFALVEACRESGCPLCSLLVKGVRAYIAQLLYENVNDGEVRAQLRDSMGFCRSHAATLIRMGDRLGTVIIYLDILSDIRSMLNTRKLERLNPRSQCIVCNYRDGFELMYLELVCQHLQDTDLRQVLEQSNGFCLPHSAMVATRLPGGETSRAFLSFQEAKIGSLRAHLTGYLNKQDIEHKTERLSLEEQSACLAAIDFMVGKID